jgi:hypothetical protein
MATRKKVPSPSMAHVSARRSDDGEHASTGSVCDKPTTPLTVPMRDSLSDMESLALGFRMEMLSLSDGGEEKGAVLTGAGLGTNFIILQWGKRTAVVRGSEMLKAWVQTFAPEEAARLP